MRCIQFSRRRGEFLGFVWGLVPAKGVLADGYE